MLRQMAHFNREFAQNISYYNDLRNSRILPLSDISNFSAGNCHSIGVIREVSRFREELKRLLG
jgi:hypothetical protein